MGVQIGEEELNMIKIYYIKCTKFQYKCILKNKQRKYKHIFALYERGPNLITEIKVTVTADKRRQNATQVSLTVQHNAPVKNFYTTQNFQSSQLTHF